MIFSIKKTENRVQEISQITRNLKVFAREFNIPIIVLSQLSRNVESRNNKRPILSDLRESGCIALKEKNVNKNGNFLENDIIVEELSSKNIQFRQQVTISKDGIIIGFDIKKNSLPHCSFESRERRKKIVCAYIPTVQINKYFCRVRVFCFIF